MLGSVAASVAPAPSVDSDASATISPPTQVPIVEEDDDPDQARLSGKRYGSGNITPRKMSM